MVVVVVVAAVVEIVWVKAGGRTGRGERGGLPKRRTVCGGGERVCVTKRRRKMGMLEEYLDGRQDQGLLPLQ